MSGPGDNGVEWEITDIIVDCGDPDRVAAFWSALLGRPIAGTKGPYVWLERSAGGIGIGFQRVAAAKSGKNRVHLDLCPPDLGAAVRRVEALGGRRVDGYEDGGFLVMADPEGNEFCLVPAEPIEIDEDGHAGYLDSLRSPPTG